MQTTLVVLDGYTLNPGDNPWDPVARFGSFSVYDRTPETLVVERTVDADIVLTNKTRLTAATLAQLPRLKLVCVLATGYNVVDLEACSRLGVPVVNVPEYGSDSVAQHAFALLLELTNHVALYHAAVQEGEWARARDFTLIKAPLSELYGKTFGIVGMGRIGGCVARIAHAFGMKVLAYNPRSRNVPEGVPVEWTTLEEVFRRSDVVSLHSPLTAENPAFVNRSLLSLMKPHAFLLNTARGGLINERDLADALNEGVIGGAGLDVAAVEPMPADSPLRGARNCIITPHIAWASLAARQRLMATTAKNIELFLAGTPQNVVNQPVPRS
ncbi:D-2-hydroxyacid dehydrogenase [Geomesophilobacter sediminis]|uniref:D-2-hydroxyacid dehydrogenase n=1 Tax=Geomesophilobacter sediminis TaxID=2798584 RepID=A0A8J7J4Q6_9BACT|nr:D-2-hydroxyacid dehydrogenase [Geomesophilobacter sediminis]MBJ6723191.1 D-2-hydroxyacid dehydrogenase [Geomesophilobacter sediminis]